MKQIIILTIYLVSDFDKYAEEYWGVPLIVEDENFFFLVAVERYINNRDYNYKYIVFDKKKKRVRCNGNKNGSKITDDILGGPPVKLN